MLRFTKIAVALSMTLWLTPTGSRADETPLVVGLPTFVFRGYYSGSFEPASVGATSFSEGSWTAPYSPSAARTFDAWPSGLSSYDGPFPMSSDILLGSVCPNGGSRYIDGAVCMHFTYHDESGNITYPKTYLRNVAVLASDSLSPIQHWVDLSTPGVVQINHSGAPDIASSNYRLLSDVSSYAWYLCKDYVTGGDGHTIDLNSLTLSPGCYTIHLEDISNYIMYSARVPPAEYWWSGFYYDDHPVARQTLTYDKIWLRSDLYIGYPYDGNSDYTDPYGRIHIEPALGDYAVIEWYSSFYNPAEVLLIRRKLSDGNYETVRTLSLGAPYYVDPSRGPTSNSCQWGKVTWDGRNDAGDVCDASDNYDDYFVGVRYKDGTIANAHDYNGYTQAPISVVPTITNVYAEDPVVLGTSGTTIHYTLSCNVNSATLGGWDVDPLTGNGASQGDNTVSWDGQSTSGDFLSSGVYDIPVSTVPLMGNPLYISASVMPTYITRDPGSAATVTVEVGNNHRKNSNEAYLTCVVYNEVGEPVRTIADGEVGAMVDVAGSDGWRKATYTETWDGKDDWGEYVEPGSYTIASCATDNAGIGCESQLATCSVEVQEDPQCKLDAHSLFTDGDQWYVEGTTDPGNDVSWTDINDSGSVVTSDSVTADTDGYFHFALADTTPGRHNIGLVATNARNGKTAAANVPIIVNDVSVSVTTTGSGSAQSLTMNSVGSGYTSFDEEVRFSPAQGQSLSIDLTSTASTDQFDAEVINPFGDATDPIRADSRLNGAVKETPAKTLWDHQTVSSGTTTLTWDGTDSGNTDFLPAGPYIIRISRSEDNPDVPTSFDVLATIESTSVDASSMAPTISDVQTFICGSSVAVAWTTDVPTNGSVLYGDRGASIARVPVSQFATFHVAYFPVTKPETTYTYWIAVKDQAGNTAVSQKQEITTESSELYGEITVTPVSDAAYDIEWSTSTAMYGKVHYARVGSIGDALTWDEQAEAAATQEHIVHLTGLSANSEYVFRVASAIDTSFAKASASSYQRFTTKTSKPSVAIEDLTENATISGATTITVTASDAVPRAPGTGISYIELSLDGVTQTLSSSDTTSGEYTFTVDTTAFARGSHLLSAYAVDDFGNGSEVSMDVFVDNSGGSARPLSSMGSMTTTSGQSASAAAQQKHRAQVTPAPKAVFTPAENDPQPVMIYTNPNVDPNGWDLHRYPSACQREAGGDNKIAITVTLAAKKKQTIRLQVTDASDQSPYVHGQVGDNWGEGYGLGHSGIVLNGFGRLVEAPGYNKPEVPKDRPDLYEITTDGNGVAKVILRMHARVASGDNFYIKAFTPKGAYLGKSGDIVSWKRMYLEVDRMYKHGSSLAADTTVGAHAVVVQNVGEFAAGDSVRIFDTDNSPGEERTIVQITAGTLEFGADHPLGTSYHCIKHAFVGKSGTLYNVNVQSQRAYGHLTSSPSDIRGETGGCFVDLSVVPDSKNPKRFIPYQRVIPDNLEDNISDTWADQKGRTNTVHVIAAAFRGENEVPDLTYQGMSRDWWSFIYVCGATGGSPPNDLDLSEEFALTRSDALAHELGHHYNLHNVDGDHSQTPNWQTQLNLYPMSPTSCLMHIPNGYDVGTSGDWAGSFCIPHCKEVRTLPDPL